MNRLHKPSSGFTIAPNVLLEDNTLSCTAKGLFCFMCSKPDMWQFSVRGLMAQLKEGQSSICKRLQELEEHGYLIRESIRDSSGRITRWDYTLVYTPQNKGNSPDVGFPHVDSPHSSKTIRRKTQEDNISPPVKNPTLPRELIAHVKDTFEAKTGGALPWGRVGRALAPLAKLYTLEQIISGWDGYTEDTEVKYLSVEAFVRKAGLYINPEKPTPKPESTSDEEFERMRMNRQEQEKANG
jgi:hypothetical protein